MKIRLPLFITLISVVAALVVVAIVALATDSANKLSVADLIKDSDLVVYGMVIATHNIWDDINGKQMDFHVADVEVYEVLKGELQTSQIQVRDLGFRGKEATSWISDSVTFFEGEEVVLILGWRGPSTNRYLSPLGLRSGKFTILIQPDGSRVVLNESERITWEQKGTIPMVDDRPLDASAFLNFVRTTAK